MRVKFGMWKLNVCKMFSNITGSHCAIDKWEGKRKRRLSASRDLLHIESQITADNCIFVIVKTILFAPRFFARNLMRSSQRRYICFIFSFWCLTWGLNSGLTPNKPLSTTPGLSRQLSSRDPLSYGKTNTQHDDLEA